MKAIPFNLSRIESSAKNFNRVVTLEPGKKTHIRIGQISINQASPALYEDLSVVGEGFFKDEGVQAAIIKGELPHSLIQQVLLDHSAQQTHENTETNSTKLPVEALKGLDARVLAVIDLRENTVAQKVRGGIFALLGVEHNERMEEFHVAYNPGTPDSYNQTWTSYRLFDGFELPLNASLDPFADGCTAIFKKDGDWIYIKNGTSIDDPTAFANNSLVRVLFQEPTVD